MMIQISRADGPFLVKEFEYENYYLKGVYSGGVYGYSHIQIIRGSHGMAYIHLYMQIWSRIVLRELRQDFDALKALLQINGVWRIIGTHELEGADKWSKFIRLLGFGPPVNTVSAEGTRCKLAIMEI